jgi:multidrug efflux pump subunit AcrA (membrane-fusion protein)
MVTDAIPRAKPLTQPQHRHSADAPEEPRGGWRKRGLIFVGALAILFSAGILIPGAGSSQPVNPDSVHRVKRGDLSVSITEQGTLESANNTEIKCKVRGQSTIIWVVEGGTQVEPGDELVRLDTLALEDAISERTKFAHLTRSGAERARATVARAELAVPEYLEGRYRSELMGLEKDLAIAESHLRTAKSMLAHAEMMAERGYISEMVVEDKAFAVTRAQLTVDVQNTQIKVLKEYTKKMELETLNGALAAAKANLAAEEERAKMDAERRDLAIEELEYCVMRAERSGLVIYPVAQPWENVPEIEEGATVHKDQVLLLMPDLSRMQVKVGIHESIIDRIKPGLAAKITLPDRTIDGAVSSVAEVTRPAGWWTGNVVKYDTIIELPSEEGLRPGMTAEVEVIVERHEDVLLVPVTAVLQTVEGDFCWVTTAEGPQRRRLELGDTDGSFIVVHSGVNEDESVVLDPLASVKEAQTAVLRSFDEAADPSWEAEPHRDASRQVAGPETDHGD